MKAKILRKLDNVWELPLAVISFLFFKLMKKLVTILYVANLRKHMRGRNCWIVLDEAMAKKKLALAVLLVNAPRWNTHAIIAKTGGISVMKELGVRIDFAAGADSLWTIVVYTYPNFKTITYLSSLNLDQNNSFHIERGIAYLALPKGEYALGLRYYDAKSDAKLPQVLADEKTVIEPCFIGDNINHFYLLLRQHRNVVHYLLHYYTYVMLRFKSWLPAKFVFSEYLPVGNPDTYFYFGALLAGERLQINVSPEAIQNHIIYYCLYDRASFPIVWGQVSDSSLVVKTNNEKATYLIRVCKTGKSSHYSSGMLQVNCLLD